MRRSFFLFLKPAGFVLAVMMSLTGCFGKMSETVTDESAGVNGSFEVIKSGYPVNWLIYTPATIPTGSYELIVDSTDAVDGERSLVFLVHECSSTGGWHSPGISKEYPAIPGGRYRVSFWVKNEGSTFRAVIGGVSAFEGQYDTVVHSSESMPDWTLVEYVYEMPIEFDTIRFELNVLEPGSFWIDYIKIEAVAE